MGAVLTLWHETEQPFMAFMWSIGVASVTTLVVLVTTTVVTVLLRCLDCVEARFLARASRERS